MTAEIIVDGVNVAGCSYYEHIVENRYKPECDCKETKIKLGYYCNEYSTSECKDNDCLYKQLQRLKQENFALTQESQQKSQTICELMQENEELKTEKLYRGIDKQFIEDANDKLYWENKRYRSALEVIKLILDTKCSIVSNSEAVGIINEVLNEG